MSVAIIIDIVFVALVIILAIVGLVRGFAQSALSLIGSFVSIVLAILVAKPFAALINAIFGANNFFGEKIAEMFYGFNDAFGAVQAGGLSATEAYNAASSAKGGIFDFLYKYIFADNGVAAGGTLGGSIGDVLGPLATIVLAAIIAFILIRIIVAILSSLMKRLTQFSIIGGIDKVLGFVFGAAKGLLITAVICVAMSALTIVFPSIGNSVQPVINETKIVKIVYNKTDELTRDYLGNKLRDFANSILGTEEDADPEGQGTSGARPDKVPSLILANKSNTLIEICNHYLPKTYSP